MPSTPPDPYHPYIAQMLWLIASQLNTLLGNEDFPVPDAQTLTAQRQATPPEDPRRALHTRLQGGTHDA